MSPGVSGLDAPRAGRLVGLRQRRADIVIPTTSGDYCILLHTAGYWELREVGGRDERIVKSESGKWKVVNIRIHSSRKVNDYFLTI